MRYYELTFIAKPILDDKEIKDLVDSLKESILSLSGEIKNELPIKSIKLAYPIEKFSSAYLVSFDLEFNPDSVQELKNKLDKDDRILRYLIFKKSAPKIIVSQESQKPEKTEPQKTAETKKVKKPKKVELDEIDKKLDEILKDEPK